MYGFLVRATIIISALLPEGVRFTQPFLY